MKRIAFPVLMWTAVTVAGCGSKAEAGNPPECPGAAPCGEVNCNPVGLACSYFAESASVPDSTCSCVVPKGGNASQGVWTCGGC